MSPPTSDPNRPPAGARPTPDLMLDRVIAAIGDHYDVDAEIGRGGMSIVYRATDLKLRRQVAIKILPPELAFRGDIRSRFLREAETAAQLSHPNIVPIYSVDERSGMVYFVMALLDGENLGQRLTREPRPPIGEVRRIACDIADALAFAHERGVVHRDIKPDNILIDRRSGRAIVTDFGIARAAEGDLRLTVTGVAVGTPAYMSPEQALGERDVDGRSDLYSLGIVVYQMLAGALPFTASNTPAMMMKHISEPPRPLSERVFGVPATLAAAVERAIAKRPEDRWASAVEFRDAVAAGDASARSEAPRPEPRLPAGAPSHAERQAERARNPEPAPVRPSAPSAPSSLRKWLDQPPASLPRLSHRGARGAGREEHNVRAPPEPSPVQPRAKNRDSYAARPLQDRVRIFRRTVAGSSGLVLMLAGINFVTTPWFPWFLFPAVGMGSRVMRQWGSLWKDGLTWPQILGRQPLPVLAGRTAATAAQSSADEVAAKLVTRYVLDGVHGGAVRRAVANRLAILGIIESLSTEDRSLLPDVIPTVNALVERTAMLAQMLHRLDTDVSSEMVARLEARIADVEREPATAVDRDRRLALLERQRHTLRDLRDRRSKVAGQLESAALALENLKLDLLKLRSSGVHASIHDVTHATQEARALSREIGHVLDAAAELRGM